MRRPNVSGSSSPPSWYQYGCGMCTIPGIGKKTAQRVVLELKEKITPLTAVEAPHLGAGDGHIVARDALVELGSSLAEAEQRLSGTDSDLTPAERVRQALRAA